MVTKMFLNEIQFKKLTLKIFQNFDLFFKTLIYFSKLYLLKNYKIFLNFFSIVVCRNKVVPFWQILIIFTFFFNRGGWKWSGLGVHFLRFLRVIQLPPWSQCCKLLSFLEININSKFEKTNKLGHLIAEFIKRC